MGICTGLFVVPVLGNYIGRRKTFILSLSMGLMGSLFLLIGVYLSSTFLMIMGNALAGGSASGAAILTYVYSTDCFG